MRRLALLAVLAVGVFVAGTTRAQDTGQPPATTTSTPATPATATPPAPSTATTTPAESAPAEPSSTTKGFGQRGSFLFSVEGVLGFLRQTVSNNGSASLDNAGFYPGAAPLLGTRFGLNGHSDSGVTYGVVGGFAHFSETGSGNGGITELAIGPRIGYAGMIPRASVVGYWLRGGPTVSYFNISGGGGTASDELTFLALSLEAFLVYTPVEHFGVLGGPSFDIALLGHESSGNSSNSALLSSYGITLGLVFDF